METSNPDPSRPILVLFLGVVLLWIAYGTDASTHHKAPAIFTFGDSLIDSGTNDFITNPSVPKSNIVPYGETFFHNPTGRWTNGRLMSDFIARNDITAYASNSTLQQTTPSSQYIGLLISQLQSNILTILESGASKIVFVALDPGGCSPVFLAAVNSTGACVNSLNTLSQGYNGALAQLVAEFNTKLNSSTILLASKYDTIINLVQNGTSRGFTGGSTGCCGGGPFNGNSYNCGRGNYTLCSNGSEYAYWDFTHQTERVYKILADLFWKGNTSYIQPINIKQLAVL